MKNKQMYEIYIGIDYAKKKRFGVCDIIYTMNASIRIEDILKYCKDKLVEAIKEESSASKDASTDSALNVSEEIRATIESSADSALDTSAEISEASEPSAAKACAVS